MGTIKSLTAQEIVEHIQSLEDRSDRCYEGLELLDRNSWNVGVWASLVQAAVYVESQIPREAYGGKSHLIMLLNLSRIMPIMCGWCKTYGNSRTAPISQFRWSRARQLATYAAFAVAGRYPPFCVTFPAWHRDLMSAETFEPNGVTFFSSGDRMERRVSAYQKGIGPGNIPAPTVPRVPDMEALILEAMETIRNGALEIHYPRPDRLLRVLNETYQSRLAGAFRRYEGIPLGGFSLRDFRTVYASLTAIATAHEHLSFRWLLGRRYPIESIVINHPRQQWVDLLSGLSEIAPDIVDAIISDMTLGASRVLDLLVHPFVALDDDGRRLGVLPHFVLASNAEENMLRTCSNIRPRFYNAASALKEAEMREELDSLLSPFRLSGPAKLRGDLPDIDLLVEDVETSTVAICELKWGRKPYSVIEHLSRDAELFKGTTQLQMIQTFLSEHTDFLRERGLLGRNLVEYRRVEYLLVARDHMKWIPPDGQRAIVSFNPFKSMLEKDDLAAALDRLLSYDWLPVEGKDFRVEFKDDTVNGVTMRSESFFPM